MQKKFITLKLSDIHPYPNNPRINENAVADVIESRYRYENKGKSSEYNVAVQKHC